MKNLLFFACLLAASAAHAAPEADTTAAPRATARPWYRPAHLALQTGGGLGMVAAGAGYAFAKDRLETDVLLGYVPKRYAGSTLGLASLKFMYSPFRLQVADKVQVLPFTIGAYFSYTHGTLNSGQKGQYPADYYYFSTNSYLGVLAGGRVTYLAAPVKATGRPRRLSAYYELGSNDLYLSSYITNPGGGLALGQILTLALGGKADF